MYLINYLAIIAQFNTTAQCGIIKFLQVYKFIFIYTMNLVKKLKNKSREATCIHASQPLCIIYIISIYILSPVSNSVMITI